MKNYGILPTILAKMFEVVAYSWLYIDYAIFELTGWIYADTEKDIKILKFLDYIYKPNYNSILDSVHEFRIDRGVHYVPIISEGTKRFFQQKVYGWGDKEIFVPESNHIINIIKNGNLAYHVQSVDGREEMVLHLKHLDKINAILTNGVHYEIGTGNEQNK